MVAIVGSNQRLKTRTWEPSASVTLLFLKAAARKSAPWAEMGLGCGSCGGCCTCFGGGWPVPEVDGPVGPLTNNVVEEEVGMEADVLLPCVGEEVLKWEIYSILDLISRRVSSPFPLHLQTMNLES